ncbi:hypothetical protein NM688_g3971 [Phlebia brevispora]|uniref:Uncharacterized protein n=1 Tax=Phlebia brevispora TaxID=194682 RepID=A0ACC1T4F6_9APHY|nr:hypothetical protein NM688_g3971 [Phlebia brevispora]
MRLMSFVYFLPLFTPALFSALRVFGLLNHAYLTSGTVFLLGLVRFSIAFGGIRSGFHHVDNPVLPSSCFACSTVPDSVFFYREHITKHSEQSTDVFDSVSRTLHFIALLTPDLITLLLLITVRMLTSSIFKNARNERYLQPSGTEVASGVNIFFSLLPNIVISRFLINLREVNSPELRFNNVPHLSYVSALSIRIPPI